MKIHANAPLGPKGRATMVKRVLEEGSRSRRRRGRRKLGRSGPDRAAPTERVTGCSAAAGRAARQTDAAGVRRLQTGWDRVHVCVDDAPAWPTPRCCRTRRRRPLSAS
jgi:hypothetical protein